MGVRVAARNGTFCVLVLVVHVVFVLIAVLLGMVGVRVVMTLGLMEPHPSSNQGTRHQHTRRDGLAKPGHGERCANEWCHRKVRSSARGAEVPQRHDEQGQADAVGPESEEQRTGQPGHWLQGRANGQSECQVHTARDQPLDRRNPRRVGERHLAGQAVVGGTSHFG